jgi:uncharacterized membrane protein YidH (DUF202 family)
MNFASDIYFLDAKSLALELRTGTFSEHRAVKQAIAQLIISGGASSGILQVGSSQGPAWSLGVLSLKVSAFIVGGLITYLGMWLTYQVNRKGDGKDYFLRFAALSLPISVKLIVQYVLFCGLLLLASLLLASLSPSTFGFTVVYLPFAVLFGFYVLAMMFYLRMRTYLAIVSGLDDRHDV